MARKIGAELDEIRNNLKIDITSILFASKDGVTEKELLNEYFNIKGQSIPYREMGFLNLFDFMKDPFMKNSVRIERRGPTWVYFGIHNKETQALGNMVRHQNDLLKSRRDRNRMFEASRNSYLNNIGISNSPMPIPHTLHKTIEDILKNENDFEISSDKFEREYLMRTGFDLKSTAYGYPTACELFESLPHLVRISSKSNNQFKIQLVLKTKETIKENGDAPASKVEENLNTTDRLPNKTAASTQLEDNETMQLTFEEEIIENLKQTIDAHCQQATPLSSIMSLYKKHTQKTLEISKLGYTDISKFLGEKLSKYFHVIPGEFEHCIISKTSKLQRETLISTDSSLDNSDDNDESYNQRQKKIEILKDDVRKTLDGYVNQNVSLKNFLSLFERKLGRPFNSRDYSQPTLEHSLKRLAVSKTIAYFITDEFQHMIRLLPKDNSNNGELNSHQKIYIQNAANSLKSKESSLERETKDMTKEQITKYRADRNQHLVLADADLNPSDVWRDFLKCKTINVIVSNVNNPCDFNIQLVENKFAIENLMNELELTYCGFGASYYDMPVEYITVGRYCAGLFPLDSNWHRCKILEVDSKRKIAKVSYIDYGGNDYLSFDKLKFLDKKFAKLPIQVVTAKLFNIKRAIKNIWRADTQNYLLNLLKDKVLVGTIMGVNNEGCEGSFSLDLNMLTTSNSANGNGICPRGTTININKRVVQDGFGEFYDETTDKEYILFEDFRKRNQEELDLEEEILENKDLISELLETNNTQFSKIDLNNNNPDEESSPIFRKPLNDIKSRKQVFPKISQNTKVLLFRINKIVYVYWKQIADLIKMDHEVFWEFLTTLGRDEFLKKLKYSSESKGLFDTLHSELVMETKFIYLFEFQKLGKLLELTYREPILTIMKKRLNLSRN